MDIGRTPATCCMMHAITRQHTAHDWATWFQCTVAERVQRWRVFAPCNAMHACGSTAPLCRLEAWNSHGAVARGWFRMQLPHAEGPLHLWAAMCLFPLPQGTAAGQFSHPPLVLDSRWAWGGGGRGRGAGAPHAGRWLLFLPPRVSARAAAERLRVSLPSAPLPPPIWPLCMPCLQAQWRSRRPCPPA